MQYPAFSIMTRKADADWELVMTSQPNVTTVLAHFDLYEDAEQAMMAIQHAVLTRKTLPASRLTKLIAAIIVLGFIWVFFGRYVLTVHRETANVSSPSAHIICARNAEITADTVLQMQDMRQRNGLSNPGLSRMPAPASLSAPPDPKPTLVDGVPQSADDMLKAPH